MSGQKRQNVNNKKQQRAGNSFIIEDDLRMKLAKSFGRELLDVLIKHHRHLFCDESKGFTHDGSGFMH
jgi:hypothetical protein